MPSHLLLDLIRIAALSTKQYLQSVSLKFLWLRTWSPASHWIGRWKHSRLYCQPWLYVHSYPQPHLWVPSIFQRRFCSAVINKQGSLVIYLLIFHIHGLEMFFFFLPHLEFSVRGKDANPSIVVIGYDNVTTHVDSHAGWALQLSWWSAPYSKSHLKLAIIGKHLKISK